MDERELARMIEAVLFFRAEPVTVKELSDLLSISPKQVETALGVLASALEGRGIQLIRQPDTATLATAPEAAEIVERVRKESLTRNLGRAALETLAIVLYRGPVTRSEIDYIRGVNSTFTLRNLLMRALIERVPNPKDQRGYLYQPTAALLGHLGVTHVSELPDFASVQKEVKNFEERAQDEKEDHEAV